MADPSSIVPCKNSSENLFTDDILGFLELPDHPIDDLITQEVPSEYPAIQGQFSEQINDCVNPLENPLILELFNDTIAESSHTTSFGVPGKMDNRMETYWGTESLNIEDYSTPLSVLPNEPIPFTCNFCQVLREIIHTNGLDVTKLEIHGRVGMICHAVLDQPGSVDGVTPDGAMFDFSSKSMEDVKQFLTQYCKDKIQAGYMMIKDPLSIFYEALCVGLVWDENMYNNGDILQPSPLNQGIFQSDQAGNSNNRDKPKPSLTIQRERTRNLTLEEIENYFHLPIHEAAKKMEFSATVVKKICRKYGVRRWPHRKIQSMEKKIANLASKLSSNDPQERARAEVEIQNLQRQMAKLSKGAR